jgi:membrane-bound lytic murein transglycosylase D
VKRGDTLSEIAVRYGSATEAILQMNRLKGTRKLKLGLELVIPVPQRKGKGGEKVLAGKVAQARRGGVVAPRPEEEIPAGTPRAPVATGPIKTETVGGRTRVTYGVQEGDSLWVIATRFNVSVEDLRAWNKISKRQRTLSVGRQLEVWPRNAPTQIEERAGTVVAHRDSGGRRPATHSLAAGETLWSVAQRYGVSVEDIIRWNKIKDHRTLPTGKVLQVTAP